MEFGNKHSIVSGPSKTTDHIDGFLSTNLRT